MMYAFEKSVNELWSIGIVLSVLTSIALLFWGNICVTVAFGLVIVPCFW